MRSRIQRRGVVVFRIAAAACEVITTAISPSTPLWLRSEESSKPHRVPQLVSRGRKRPCYVTPSGRLLSTQAPRCQVLWQVNGHRSSRGVIFYQFPRAPREFGASCYVLCLKVDAGGGQRVAYVATQGESLTLHSPFTFCLPGAQLITSNGQGLVMCWCDLLQKNKTAIQMRRNRAGRRKRSPKVL